MVKGVVEQTHVTQIIVSRVFDITKLLVNLTEIRNDKQSIQTLYRADEKANPFIQWKNPKNPTH